MIGVIGMVKDRSGRMGRCRMGRSAARFDRGGKALKRQRGNQNP
ncbi:MAG TPA: hypothetical protein VFG03_14425 [Telluria sp.]|nr:hypothetical protein [Telluria sp.]